MGERMARPPEPEQGAVMDTPKEAARRIHAGELAYSAVAAAHSRDYMRQVNRELGSLAYRPRDVQKRRVDTPRRPPPSRLTR